MRQRREADQRIQKYLANLGLGSRRQIEQWIVEGRIRVDGKQASLGDKVSTNSRISLNGRPIRRQATFNNVRMLAYNKPEGEVCTRSDPQKRPTVFRNLPRTKGERWVSVGRLDINTRGLLLFTNNGELANLLMHPRQGIEREYLCRIFGNVEADSIEHLTSGVTIDGKLMSFNKVKKQRGEGKNTWYAVSLSQGRYREVRKLWESVGCQVSRLIRVRYGNLSLPRKLKLGQYMELSSKDIQSIRSLALGENAERENRPKQRPRRR